mgnify:CR=1 FL=1
MNWQNVLINAASDVINSPRLLAASATTTAGLSVAEMAQVVTGWVTNAGIFVGVVATILLIRIHLINYKNSVITNKLLMRQLADIENEKDVA